MKTSLTTTTTMRNWNVDDLLGSLLLERREGQRRHFHQLFCLLRTTNRRTLWNSVLRELGHFCSRVAVSSVCMNSTTWSPNCGTGKARCPQCASRCAPEPLAVAAQRREVSAPVVVHTEVHRACRPGGRSLLARGVVQLALLSLAFAIVGLRGGEWWLFPARAMATLISAYRKCARRRRSLRRFAAPACAAPSAAHMKSSRKGHTQKKETLEWKVVCCLLFVVVVSDACLDVRCVRSQRHGDAMSH